jgi:SSS family solute:Na+ symporter
MAENMYRALWAWIVCVTVTIVVSLMTSPRPAAELEGLVLGSTGVQVVDDAARWYQQPIFWAGVVMVAFIALNLALW